MRNKRVFESLSGSELVVKHRRSGVILETTDPGSNYNFTFKFTPKGFISLISYINEVANKSWQNIDPRVADSCGSDYFEYYDRKLDNNGDLRLGENSLILGRPSLESNKLYQFNKRKMESFIFDCKERNII